MRLVLAVFLGGCVGTGLRFTADLALPHTGEQFPTGTLVVNVCGALVLGWLVGGFWTRTRVPAWFKMAIGPGLLGSFTTFSAVMVSLVSQTAAGFWVLATGYLVASVGLGFGAAALGLWLGGRHGFGRRLHRDREPQ